MKTNRISLFFLFVQAGLLLASASELILPRPAVALVVTDTASEVGAPLPTEEPALLTPTEMVVPITPTPSRLEFAVENARLKAKVLDIEKPYRVYLGIDSSLGTDIIHNPGPGNMFLGLGIKVANFTGAPMSIKWSDVYLVNKYQDKWYPVWAAHKRSNAAMDPFTIAILQSDQVHPDFDPNARFDLSHNGYLRAIFCVPRDNLYYFFGFADLPLIEINWRYQ